MNSFRCIAAIFRSLLHVSVPYCALAFVFSHFSRSCPSTLPPFFPGRRLSERIATLILSLLFLLFCRSRNCLRVRAAMAAAAAAAGGAAAKRPRSPPPPPHPHSIPRQGPLVPGRRRGAPPPRPSSGSASWSAASPSCAGSTTTCSERCTRRSRRSRGRTKVRQRGNWTEQLTSRLYVR